MHSDLYACLHHSMKKVAINKFNTNSKSVLFSQPPCAYQRTRNIFVLQHCNTSHAFFVYLCWLDVTFHLYLVLFSTDANFLSIHSLKLYHRHHHHHSQVYIRLITPETIGLSRLFALTSPLVLWSVLTKFPIRASL